MISSPKRGLALSSPYLRVTSRLGDLFPRTEYCVKSENRTRVSIARIWVKLVSQASIVLPRRTVHSLRTHQQRDAKRLRAERPTIIAPNVLHHYDPVGWITYLFPGYVGFPGSARCGGIFRAPLAPEPEPELMKRHPSAFRPARRFFQLRRRPYYIWAPERREHTKELPLEQL